MYHVVHICPICEMTDDFTDAKLFRKSSGSLV